MGHENISGNSKHDFQLGDEVVFVGRPSAWLHHPLLRITGISTHLAWPISAENADRHSGIFSPDELRRIPPKTTVSTGPMCATTPAPAVLPSEAADRKKVPLAGGLFDYFASALIEVAKVSHKGNEQHNPGQPLHWSRGKSADHADTMLRHFTERGNVDSDGLRHSAKMAWRALAILQLELEAAGAPVARGAKLPEEMK